MSTRDQDRKFWAADGAVPQPTRRELLLGAGAASLAAAPLAGL